MRSQTHARVLTYGTRPEHDVWAEGIEAQGLTGTRFVVHVAARPELGLAGGDCALATPALGAQAVMAALPAVALGRMAGLGWDEVQKGLTSLGYGLRLVPAPGMSGSTVLDDSYNASPLSTCAALKVLGGIERKAGSAGRRIAALGDMLELGEYSEQGHREVGRCAAGVVDVLVTVGPLSRAMADEAQRAGLPAERVHMLADARAAAELLRNVVEAGDVVLVKGSHSIGMQAVVDALREGAR
jgi:UDP-N-acetylmuramoyl-tripeptide--D-alanyl-D-alanine ligase